MGVVYPSPEAFCYPPHTLATVASSLRQAGYRVRAFDGVIGALPSAMFDADTIAVFVSYASLDTDLVFLQGLRKHTKARLIAFGPATRFVREQILNGSPVDAVLIGEAEGFCVAALRYLEDKTAPHEAQVLTPQQAHSACCDAEGLVCDLDALPVPAWELLPYRQYKLLTVFASRGCPDRCAYCPYAAAQGHRLRTRSAENILAELSWLSRHYRPARLVFRDPVFAHDRGRVVAICEGILSRGLRLPWECESRPEHFDVEVLRLMRRAGCQWVKIGVETTDSQVLQNLSRVGSEEEATAYLQRVAEVVRACTDMKLQCRAFVMAGLPGQDVPMAQRTREFIEQLGPTALSVKAFERYPGLGPSVAAVSVPAPTGRLDRAAATVVPVAGPAEVETQLAILQQTQVATAPQGSDGLLAHGKRWLGGLLAGR
jgi:radical SAM superfamily enzyme YgiQ (UPF0313 family)